MATACSRQVRHRCFGRQPDPRVFPCTWERGRAAAGVDWSSEVARRWPGSEENLPLTTAQQGCLLGVRELQPTGRASLVVARARGGRRVPTLGIGRRAGACRLQALSELGVRGSQTGSDHRTYSHAPACTDTQGAASRAICNFNTPEPSEPCKLLARSLQRGLKIRVLVSEDERQESRTSRGRGYLARGRRSEVFEERVESGMRWPWPGWGGQRQSCGVSARATGRRALCRASCDQSRGVCS